MSYPLISTINASNDLTLLFVYANSVTYGMFTTLILVSFFIIALIGTYFAQIRLRGYSDFKVSLASSSFVTSGLAVIMASANGLLPIITLVIVIVINILSVLWLFLDED